MVSATNSHRQALLSLIALFLIGSALLAFTDTGRAMREAGEASDGDPDPCNIDVSRIAALTGGESQEKRGRRWKDLES